MYGAIAVGVWLLGDKFGYETSYRIVIIAIVLLTLPFALVGAYLVSRRSKKEAKAQEALAAQEAQAAGQTGTDAAAAPAKLSAPSGNYNELTTSAEEAVQYLKGSNLNSSNGKDAIYALPWYIVAGTPKSGKTSLVLSSGLNFQSLPSQRQSELKSVRPTRSVDWRVTSEGVFLDTAGRYQTEGVDQDEWASLLDTIKKYRGTRPLDGMILAVSAERILNSSESEIEQMAKVLRARIDEAIQRTKIRFPIYLVFTHADSIEGFRDSFSTSQKEGESLVWGATIPLEQTANAHSLFDGEYDLLQTSVMKRRLLRLSAPFAPIRQLKIFNFPLHFGTGRRKLGAFVSTLFRPNPFSESPFLRGFYFTAVPVNRAAASPRGRGQTQVPQTVGQSYFSEKLFRDVILRDRDLVATFQSQQVRPPILGWLLTFSGAAFVLLLLALAAYSLYQNKQMVDQATERGEAVLTMVKSDKGKDIFAKKTEETRTEIDTTEKLREKVAELDDYERNGAPFSMRLGFYSGSRLFHEALLPTYFNAVEPRFKNPTVKKLEDDLRKFAAAPAVNLTQLNQEQQKKVEEELGKNYDLLKAYLMLSGDYRDKAEASAISTALAPYWKSESKVPSGTELLAQQQLEFYAKQVDRDEFPRIKPDATLVDGVRKKLQAFPPVFRYYKRKITEISKDIDSKMGAKTAATVLANNGSDTTYIEGAYQVPGAFTIEGFPLMKKAISEADKELSADDWVMGEQGKNTVAQTTDASTLESQYYRDYIEHWKSYAKAIQVKPFKKETAAKTMQAFSSANSPLEILLADINRNVSLSAKPKADGWWEWIKSFFIKTESASTEKTPVEGEFHALITFMGEQGKTDSAAVGKYRNELGKLYTSLNRLSPDDLNQLSKNFDSDKDTKLLLNDRAAQIQSLLGGFEDKPSGQVVGELLLQPINNLRVMLGADAKTQIAKSWAEIANKAKDIEKGYPFEQGTNEANLESLKAYLNPTDGTLTKFYNENLAKYLDIDQGTGQVKPKPDSPVQFTDEFIVYLNNAFRLRKGLFGNSGNTASFGYEFRLGKVDGAVVEITIDGQPKIDSSNGTGAANLKFPGGGGDTGVIMNFVSSTTEPTASAPTSAPGDANTTAAPTPTPATGSSTAPGGSSNSLKYPGTWGLFRFFDAGGEPKKQAGGEYLLTYKLGTKTVTATVKATGDVDLFDRNVFRLVKVPQTFMKQ